MIDIDTDPRRIGGRYRSAYWGQEYTVTAIRDGWITSAWEDGAVTTHCTAWEWGRDVIVGHLKVCEDETCQNTLLASEPADYCRFHR